MKFVTFNARTSTDRLGAVDTDGRIIDLAEVSHLQRKRETECFSSMQTLIESGRDGLKAASEALLYARDLNKKDSDSLHPGVWHQWDEVTLLTPLQRPLSLRDFWIFEDHVKAGWKKRGLELPDVWYEMPTYYKGNPLSIIGPDEELEWPSFTEKLDYELEMGVIIGKKGRDISEEKGHDYIFGYTVINDWSARDIQRKEMMCRLGPAKGKDFATSLGPCIVTADEIDPYNLRMTAKINGEVWSNNNSGTCYWEFNQLIAHISMGETIYPGELLGSGTVGGGCGLELDRWIQPGDVVELEIENIGVLRNRIIRKEMKP